MQIYKQELISLISAYSFIYKDKYSIFRNRFKLTKICLEDSAGFIFEITTFNEEKIKDFFNCLGNRKVWRQSNLMIKKLCVD